ncbi:MAG: YfhO family protein [Bacteroidota bacterium]|nr:YfhO family protein [Bacteroidota bacterium]MDP4234699.1 YfhO family protein [Bacteroidota bacterium]MDP4243923.1 YfhO family protein [Bacteroidota bacterium]MDP4288855.1 YfhO family protein [Bacteroidota bacterium]
MRFTSLNIEVRQAFVTLAALLIVLVAAFYPILFEGKSLLPSDLIDTMTLPFSETYQPPHAYNSLVTDGYLQSYPLKHFTAQALANGHLAFWNPYILNGYPEYVEGMWTYNPILLLPFSFETKFNLLLIFPLLVAGFGMYLLLRDYDIRIGVARIFATAYMLNALFVSHLLAHFIPAAFSFAPYVLLFLHRYGQGSTRRDLALAGTALGLGILAGNVQTAAFLLILTSCYWLTLRWSEKRRVHFGPLALALLIGIGIGMAYILPAIELLYAVANGGVSFSTSFQRGYTLLSRILSLPMCLTFFVPQLAGSIRGVTVQAAVGVYPIDFQGAIGFLPLLLAFWGAIHLWKRLQAIRPFVILATVGLAIPICTPLFHFLYHRFFVVFLLGACVTGAIAFEAILKDEQLQRHFFRWLHYALVILIVLIALLTLSTVILHFEHDRILSGAMQSLMPRFTSAAFASGNNNWIVARIKESVEYWSLLRPIWIATTASCLFSLALLWVGLKQKIVLHRIMLTSLWIIISFQLILFARSWLPATNTDRFPIYPSTQETRLLHSLSRDSRVCFFRQIAPNTQTMFIDNENVIYGISEATGYKSLVPRCLFNEIGVTPDMATQRLLSRFNVGTICTATPIGDATHLVSLNQGPIWIYRVPTATPRAFFARSTATLSNDQIVLDSLRHGSSWPAALFTPDQTITSLHDATPQRESIALLQDLGSEISFHAHSDRVAYFVLTDTYYPGWKCRVDGAEVNLLRCNYAMRAILLHAGDHVIEFEFRPDSFNAGLWITIFTSLSSLLTAIFGHRRANRQI